MCYVKLSRKRPDFEKLSRRASDGTRTLYSPLALSKSEVESFWLKTKKNSRKKDTLPKNELLRPKNWGAYTANIYSGKWDTRKKCKSYKYLP